MTGTEFGGRPMTPQEAATMDDASSVWVKDRVAAPEDCASPIARWDSCGGSCPTCVTGCCGAGDDCFKENENFSQCRPVGDCPAGWACEASPSPPPPVVDPP